jgi:hypothetical protein
MLAHVDPDANEYPHITNMMKDAHHVEPAESGRRIQSTSIYMVSFF